MHSPVQCLRGRWANLALSNRSRLPAVTQLTRNTGPLQLRWYGASRLQRRHILVNAGSILGLAHAGQAREAMQPSLVRTEAQVQGPAALLVGLLPSGSDHRINQRKT